MSTVGLEAAGAGLAERTGWTCKTALTLDIDWAPDYAIDYVADLLVAHRVCATWFVTHSSAAVERLRAHADLFELGIHPNFLPGSTQGDSDQAVLEHCMELVPEARSMRTHALVQSSHLLGRVRSTTPITVDVSLFLPHQRGLMAFDYPLEAGVLRRVPYIWEDDAEMYRTAPDWDTVRLASASDGLAVYCFHPVHVFLNSVDMRAYRSLGAASAEEASARRYEGSGAGSAFKSLLSALSDAGASGETIDRLASTGNYR